MPRSSRDGKAAVSLSKLALSMEADELDTWLDMPENKVKQKYNAGKPGESTRLVRRTVQFVTPVPTVLYVPVVREASVAIGLSISGEDIARGSLGVMVRAPLFHQYLDWDISQIKTWEDSRRDWEQAERARKYAESHGLTVAQATAKLSAFDEIVGDSDFMARLKVSDPAHYQMLLAALEGGDDEE